MSPHDELDQLSAYVDGELDAADRARVDAHLPTCAECRATLDALRATIADLAALPVPAPSELDSWALRSALRRARTPVRRWQRFALAGGTAAAAVVAVVGFLAFNDRGSASHENAAAPAPQANVPVFATAQNFDKFSAQQHLLGIAGVVPQRQPALAPAPAAKGGSAGGGGATRTESTAPINGFSADYGASDARAVAPDAAPTADLDRCVGIIQRSSQDYLAPVRYELATFDSKPAFLLFFHTTDQYILWVVSRPACDVLFWAKTGKS